MKILMIFNMFLLMNFYMNMMMTFNYLYLNIFISPLKQLIYLIMYMIFMTINILILKQYISMNLFILLIIFISGLLVLFSYFISLINNMTMKNNMLNLIYLNSFFIILMMIFMKQQLFFFLKNLNFNYMKNNKNMIIKKFFLEPNFYILFMFIIFLVMMLFIMTKICLIKYKNLRSKKWKK
uniref:NADH dehydrogenase subunit 6 n=1 Tax=Bombus filchnerae TaxID=395525 RepID=A0A8E5MDM0_9HYME|nr:NADH dehydrogenase subunit 6 [Bombus filchnerae]QTZ18844.1 NADH dehydrogenase subunit 6 [Bombus filchnerae]WKW52611.1 NADH dehydrogenase subunit 6 [Bombus filchnerae]